MACKKGVESAGINLRILARVSVPPSIATCPGCVAPAHVYGPSPNHIH